MQSAERPAVPADGSALYAAQWGAGTPSVLALHGITSTHMAWPEVANRLPDVTLLAPDLRGRGRSAHLGGPYGFATHVADLVALLDSAGCERVVVVGHSMGGFVAVALAATHPDRVSRLVLVDGGLPLGRPGEEPVGSIDDVLGPAAERLSMTFPSRDAYRDFWRAHPALGPIWGPAVERYVDNDLVGQAPELHPSCSEAAMRTDGAELVDHAAAAAALVRVTAPISFLRAERGLLDAEPLYPEETAARWLNTGPGVDSSTVPDTNHYSVVLADHGADAVAAAVLGASRVH
ncbi:MAG: hypothetical protein QOI06_1058 [Nocardioidaceae bacterium]|jgi:lipase|nr:hypothetical protein [Nocardioidaceae bacterium]